MKKTIGIFAHVDAGKTTFSEQLLFHTNMIRSVGRVDHQSTSLDTHEIEKKRGITIFTDQAHFDYKGDTYYLLDTPGHVDFSSEMERAIQVLDYAIVVISGIDGIQSHTDTVVELLLQAKVPIMFFINKLDAAHADKEKVLTELKKNYGAVIPFDTFDYEGLAEHSETLLEMFLMDDLNHEVYVKEAKSMFQKQIIFPVLSGSALKSEGIQSCLEWLYQLTATAYSNDGLSGRVYKVKYIKGVRHIFIKLLSGQLRVRDYIGEEKITDIKRVFGIKLESIGHLEAGDIGAITGVNLNVGDVFGDAVKSSFEMVPTLKTKLIFDAALNPKDVYKSMKILEDEDPSLIVDYSSKKEITLGIMGTVQLEILEEEIQNRFDYEVDFESPEIIYKETIDDAVIGCGHFEPLKHYAEVILKIEKNGLGEGITFTSECSTDHLTVGNQNLVAHHVFEKQHRGILTGSDLTDLKITLMTGAAHNKHTHGGDFREATIRALRHGLEQAKNVLLEPIYEAIIKVPFTDMGRILTDVTAAHGTAETEMLGDDVKIIAKVPVATFKDYPMTLQSITSGKGKIKLRVIGYQPCHNTEEVVERIAYDKITDKEYPSASIFCAKGKGYTVPWEEARSHMHTID